MSNNRMSGMDPRDSVPFSFILKKVVARSAIYIILFFFIGMAIFASKGIIKVEEGEMAILIRKTGADLSNDMAKGAIEITSPIIAPPAKDNVPYKGIQLKPVPEGWHFYNPYTWEFKIERQVTIAPGQVGVKIRLFGDHLAFEERQVLANKGEKGIVRDILRPGQYLINPYAYRVEQHPAIAVPAGSVGVVTNLAGSVPKNSNKFLVNKGERGVVKKAKSPGTYYVNPYKVLITPVSLRAHRFNMTGKNSAQFPSFDGFPINMEGYIVWRIDPARVAEVFVKYKDRRNIIACIEEKIILPNARSFIRIQGSKHLAKEFISGETRGKFQEEFSSAVTNSCSKQGIIINLAKVTDFQPPKEITAPIKAREMAVQERNKLESEKKREEQEKILKVEEERKHLEVKKIEAETKVEVNITNANREKEVAIIEMEKKLEVAKQRLIAALNEAEAIILKARAEADVVKMNNKAEAAAIEEARTAFGTGENYVKYLLMKKVSGSLGYILSNTDSAFLKVFEDMVSKPQPMEPPAKQAKNK